MRRSGDEGKTWGAERVLFTDPDAARSAHNPVAIVTPAGRVILWVSRFRFQPLPHRREAGAWAWSDDHGATWSPFATFDGDETRSSYYMTDVIGTADGLLGCMATFPASGVGNCHAVMWHSGDGGKTWAVRGALTQPAENRGDEVALLDRGEGEILCLLRTRRRDGVYPKGLSSFVSRNGGRSWQEGENLYGQLGVTLQRPFLTRLDAARVLLTGRDVDRKEVVSYVSRDNGRTFGEKRVVDSYAKDGAYTSCLVLAGGDVLMVYYGDRAGALAELRAERLQISG
jgi:hypothetical protein